MLVQAFYILCILKTLSVKIEAEYQQNNLNGYRLLVKTMQINTNTD